MSASDRSPPPALHIDELVLTRRAGESLADLAAPLADELAGHGVPDPAGTAAAILDALDVPESA